MEAALASVPAVFDRRSRSLHLKMAHAFIAQKVKDPRGTGGTDVMKWRAHLRVETAQQMITA